MTTRRHFLSLAAAAGASSFGVFADSARIGDIVRLADLEGSGWSGEVLVQNLSDASSVDFRSLSVGGYGNMRGDLSVESIGIASGLSGQQLSAQTAYLFSQFRAGTLSGYDYGNGSPDRSLSADELQEAIRALEGSGGPADGQAAAWVAEANAAVTGGAWDQQWGDGTLTGTYNGLNSLGDVRLLRLERGSRDRDGVYQASAVSEQLMLIPSPDAAWLGLVGLMLLRPLARRM